MRRGGPFLFGFTLPSPPFAIIGHLAQSLRPRLSLWVGLFLFSECEIEADSCFFESADSRSVGAMTKLREPTTR
jgi:hypothetical protein